MPNVKPNWKKPVPPEPAICPECGYSIKPVAVMDVDTFVLLGWDCDMLHEEIDDATVHEWPFTDDFATAKDLEELGFVVV